MIFDEKRVVITTTINSVEDVKKLITVAVDRVTYKYNMSNGSIHFTTLMHMYFEEIEKVRLLVLGAMPKSKGPLN